MEYAEDQYVILMDGCFWRIYEVSPQIRAFVVRRDELCVRVSKDFKRQSPYKPSWHIPLQLLPHLQLDTPAYTVPRGRIVGMFENKDVAEQAYHMLRSVHEKHGDCGDEVIERCKLVIEMMRSDARELD